MRNPLTATVPASCSTEVARNTSSASRRAVWYRELIRRLPRRYWISAADGAYVAEVAQQAAQHAEDSLIDPWNREHPFARGARDLILGDVHRELVVPDLQR